MRREAVVRRMRQKVRDRESLVLPGDMLIECIEYRIYAQRNTLVAKVERISVVCSFNQTKQ
jgi:hypothetical protein